MIVELAYGQSNCVARAALLEKARSHPGRVAETRSALSAASINTLATDVLTIGRIYEVVQIKERDGYYVLSLGEFTMARFRPVSAVEAGYG